MICKYAEFFCWKNVSSFCSAKATHIFSAKNIRILYIESAKTLNEMTLNELVKLTTLWTTGPWMRPWACAGWCDSAHFGHTQRHFFACHGPYIFLCKNNKTYPTFYLSYHLIWSYEFASMENKSFFKGLLSILKKVMSKFVTDNSLNLILLFFKEVGRWLDRWLIIWLLEINTVYPWFLKV